MINGAFIRPNPIIKYPAMPVRARGYTFGDDISRESLTPTDWPLLYTKGAVGTDTSAMSTTINRYQLITDVNIGDNVDIRTVGMRIDRNYPSTLGGFPVVNAPGATNTVTMYMGFVLSSATAAEGFVGIVASSAALTAPPTTTRHMGVYWDLSANTDFLLTSADGTTQATTDTNDTVDVNRKILKITWTGEDAATVQLLNGTTGALSTATSTHTVSALNGTSENSYEAHWFMETEAGAAKQLNMMAWQIMWT